MHLDVDLIRNRRNALGLSQRAVARQLGMSLMTVTRLEAGGNQDDLPLRLLVRLADVLAVDPADLFARGPAPDTADEDLVRRAGALLAAAAAPVTTATLADALGVRTSSARAALTGLDAALRPAGLRLHHGPAGATIVDEATAADRDQLGRLLRGQHARHGLTAADATLLARALAGTLDPAKLATGDQIALARLHNAGLVDADLRVSDDVREGLGLAP